MTDPDGNVIKSEETFSDKNGKISESSFRIPSEATPGMWNINVKSGSNFANVEIDVLSVTTEGMVISTSEGPEVEDWENHQY